MAPLGTCGSQQYRRGAIALAVVVPLVDSTVLIMSTGPLRVLAISLLGLQPDPWQLHLNTPLIPVLVLLVFPALSTTLFRSRWPLLIPESKIVYICNSRLKERLRDNHLVAL